MLNRLLRNTNARIRYFYGKILVIRIEYHLHPTALDIILDRIFYQIRKRQCELDFIHFCNHRSAALKDQLNIRPRRNGSQTLQQQFQHLVHIHCIDVDIRRGSCHLDQREQICDDLVLPVNLLCDICHKLTVQLRRHVLLCDQ